MQGTEAPMTTAANLASAKLVTVLKKIFPANRKTIGIGQHDIQYDQIRFFLSCFFNSLIPINSRDYLITFSFKNDFDGYSSVIRIIIDNQNFLVIHFYFFPIHSYKVVHYTWVRRCSNNKKIQIHNIITILMVLKPLKRLIILVFFLPTTEVMGFSYKHHICA